MHETSINRQQWQQLDDQIRTWWDSDLHTAHEADLRQDPTATLLFLPWPYSSAGGSEATFPEMYAWDSYFINLALLAHDRPDIVRYHILNYLFMIERYGMMLNGNRTFYRGRSQTPVFPDSIWRYYEATGDRDLLSHAYPYLVREYTQYWNAPHHQTPTSLSTNLDIAGTDASPLLAAVSEVGLDFTAIFGPDVRECVPLTTNCALVRYARVLANIAPLVGRAEDVAHWEEEANVRSERIRTLCWDDEQHFFFEYNFVTGRRQPFWSLCAYWTLWAGVATPEQAHHLVTHLARFEQLYGLAFTDRAYPSPFPEFQWLQWGYPAGWPPIHILTVSALASYGYSAESDRIAAKFLSLMLDLYQQTGKLYEKYNVCDGTAHMPVERYETPPMHGWSSAAIVLLGRQLFPLHTT